MKTKFCSNCGAKISQKALFCGECGSKIERITEPLEIKSKQCPNCNYTTDSDESYCPDCGKKLLAGGKENKSSKQEQQAPIKKELKKVVHPTPEPVKKKKRGLLRTLGKVALWGFVIVILGVVALYFIGDSPDEYNTTESELKTETPIKVREANAVLTNEISFPVMSSSKVQVFNYTDSVKISLPPDFTSKNQKLFISKAEVDPTIMVEDFTPLMMVDLTLNKGEQPSKPLDLSYTYNAKSLNPNFTAEEQLAAFRWDEEGGGWVGLATHIDEDSHSISVLVDHFSIIVILVMTKVIIDAGIVVSTTAEILLNDVYFTPKKNFRILYSKKGIIDGSRYLDNTSWKKKVKDQGMTYKGTTPHYIQDVGYFLESALDRYTNEYHFKNPAGKRKGFLSTYQKSITVKMDSYWGDDIMEDSNYEKIFEVIHIPTINASYDLQQVKKTLSHELFHAVQAIYYHKSGMVKPWNQWWLESTAEYAAYELAWPISLKDMNEDCGSDYLTFSVTDRGSKRSALKNGWYVREYEYLTSLWIKYLVDNGMDFRQMIEYDAANFSTPIISLGKYISKNHKFLNDVYRDFANWMVFSENGGLNDHPIATFGSGKNPEDLIAVKTSKLNLGSEKEINYSFDLPNHYSSKTWAIKLIDNATTKKKGKKPIIIEAKDKSSGIQLDLFVLPDGKRFLDPPKPLKSIFAKDKPVMLMVENNDILYVSASTVGLSGKADVVVQDAGILLEIDPAELPNVKAREANDFAITAKNIPEEIKKVTFEWNYNDGSEKGIHDFVTVSNGEAKQKISHRYAESNKEEIYPLKVILKEAGKNTILSEAEALVTLPLAKPVLSVTPGIAVGPPGETFDMEAKAYPRNTYKFVWEISGFGETFTQEGEMSGIAPIIDEEGEYSVTVKLYDLAGNYLNKTQASISVEPDELDTEGVDGIVGIDEEEKPFTHSGYWVLYDTKSIDGCQFYESECWPLENCSGSAGSYSISIGSSTCGSNASGKSGSGTYTVPPSKLIPGETLTFEVTARGSGYSRVDVSYYENINKMSFDESGSNTGESSSWNRKIIGCWADASPSTGEYKIPENNNLGGALVIDGGGSIGTKTTYRHYLFLYKWQK